MDNLLLDTLETVLGKEEAKVACKLNHINPIPITKREERT